MKIAYCYRPYKLKIFIINLKQLCRDIIYDVNVLLFISQGARGFPGTPGLPGIKGHRVSMTACVYVLYSLIFHQNIFYIYYLFFTCVTI